MAVLTLWYIKARPGVITSEELEQEKSGSSLRYSFDIKGE
jgi:hypothetical protein